MKLYKVNKEYIDFLCESDPEVMRDDKIRQRIYCGFIHPNKRFNYLIPLSSPKLNNDYIRLNDGNEISINENDPTVKYIETLSNKGRLEVIGKLMLGKMFPAPYSELEEIHVSTIYDYRYKNLVIKEFEFIKKHFYEIKNICENTIYKLKNINNEIIGADIRKCVDFNLAEKRCRAWEYKFKIEREEYKELFTELEEMGISENQLEEIKLNLFWGYDLGQISQFINNQ